MSGNEQNQAAFQATAKTCRIVSCLDEDKVVGDKMKAEEDLIGREAPLPNKDEHGN